MKENETFNSLKTKGYNLEQFPAFAGTGFGHGTEHLPALLATMNPIAFAMHTVADLVDAAWRAARAAFGTPKHSADATAETITLRLAARARDTMVSVSFIPAVLPGCRSRARLRATMLLSRLPGPAATRPTGGQ